MAAASGGVVWMFVNGDHLFMSLNRGDTWTERTLPSGASNGYLAFVSAGEGWWLAPVSTGTQCSFQRMTLWKTDDGAVTWRKLDVSGVDEIRCKTGMAFSDPANGFITATDGTNPPAIYHSGDAGRAWTLSRPLQDPPGFTSTTGSALPASVA